MGAKVRQLHHKSHHLVKLHLRGSTTASYIEILINIAIFIAAFHHQPNFTGKGAVNKFS